MQKFGLNQQNNRYLNIFLFNLFKNRRVCTKTAFNYSLSEHLALRQSTEHNKLLCSGFKSSQR